MTSVKGFSGLDVLECFDSVFTRHDDVKDDHVEFSLHENGERFLAREHRLGLETPRFETHGQRFGELLLVVHEKNLDPFHRSEDP